jgi:hypothetical protein
MGFHQILSQPELAPGRSIESSARAAPYRCRWFGCLFFLPLFFSYLFLLNK